MLELNPKNIYNLFFIFFLLIILITLKVKKNEFESKKSRYLLVLYFFILLVEATDLLYIDVYNKSFLDSDFLRFSFSDSVFYLFLIYNIKNVTYHLNFIVIGFILSLNIFYNKESHFYFLGVDYLYNLIMLGYFYKKFIVFFKKKSKRFYIQNKFFIYFVLLLILLNFMAYALGFIGDVIEYFFKNLSMGFSYLYHATYLIYLICFGFLINNEISFVFRKAKERITLKSKKEEVHKICNINEKIDFDELTRIITSKKVYRNQKVSIKNISVISNMQVKYISKIINNFTGGNFNDYINKFRIEKFKENVLKKEYKNYSIYGIAEESGFGSRATFYKAFKKQELMSPTEYMKSIEMNEKEN